FPTPTRDLEREIVARGFTHVIGVDEVGRGCIAGPVLAAAAVVPLGVTVEDVADSKCLSEKKRQRIFAELTSSPGVLWSTYAVSSQRVDEINILQSCAVLMCGWTLRGWGLI
ncbi:unnamed protein product, partial [Discosporangium mesarthrocarpum]